MFRLSVRSLSVVQVAHAERHRATYHRRVCTKPCRPNTTHHALLTACRRADDVRASEVQADILRFGLRPVDAVVKLLTEEEGEATIMNGPGPAALNDA